MSIVTKDNNPKLYYELFPEEALKELDKQRDFYLKQLEAYENMRKEIKEYIENSIENGNYIEDDIDTDVSKASYDKYVNSVDLLNILNKVGGNDD